MSHTLFSNYFWENDKYGKDQYDYAREYLFDEYSEEEEWNSIYDVPDDRLSNEVYAQSEWDWEDFKYELSKFINESDTGFLLVGSAGLWDGRADGGCYINKFDDLYKFWDGCRDIKVWDEKGHLYIKASHHDGTNYAEIKQLTKKGCAYVDNHSYDSAKEVHEKLFNNSNYTRLPRYAEKVLGTK